MVTLFAIAFIAGAVSVLTPCILPVLPAIIVVAGGHGRRRVAGIVTGIVLSFCAVLLVLTSAIDALGISPAVPRYLAASLLLMLGLILLLPTLGRRVQRAAEALTSRAPERARGDGFAPGLLAGVMLGFIWTPVAGPILGGITATVAREGVGADAIVATAGYGLGMVVPLTAIAFGGRALVVRARSATAGGRGVSTAMGLVLVLTGALFFSGADARVNRSIANTLPFTSTPVAALERGGFDDVDGPTTRSCRDAERLAADRASVEERGYPRVSKLCDLGPAPAFASDLGPWLNTDRGRALTQQRLRGKVVLVEFWTSSCISCVRALPYLRGWNDRYARDGLEIVGVHTPEFAFERSLDNVRRATGDLDVSWPVALDTSYDTWDSFASRSWPSTYLIDREGRLRAVHVGEGAYDRTEDQIRQLLGVRDGSPRADARGAVTDDEPRTPETYLGSERAARFAGRATGAPEGGSGFLVDRAATYRPNERALSTDTWSYDGRWTVERERAVAGAGASLLLRYRAREVYLVMAPPRGRSASVGVSVDGRRRKTVRVTANQLYTVASDERSGTRSLRLSIPEGTAVYALSFG